MKHLLLMAALVLMTGAGFYGGYAMAESEQKTQSIGRAGTQPPLKGSSQYFTGDVTIQPLFGAKHPDAPFAAAYVTFAAGARSFWHTHPTGQHLIVTEGVGRTGAAGGKVEEFRAGDALWCPADIKHWHGASPTIAMTHIALTGATPEGKNVDWMEEVTDEQYNSAN